MVYAILASPPRHDERLSYRIIAFNEASGRAIRIALCDEFAHAVEAQRNGCHAAIVYNEQTKALYTLLLEAQAAIESRWQTRLSRKAAKKILEPLSDQLGEILNEAGFPKWNYRHDRSLWVALWGAHRDEALNYIGIMTTPPTTNILTNLDIDLEPKEWVKHLIREAGAFSPISKSVLLLFGFRNKGFITTSLPHAVPDIMPRLGKRRVSIGVANYHI